jgi:hypothetical protein
VAVQHAATASIKKPIHNVKERRQIRHPLPFDNGKFCLHLWKFFGAASYARSGFGDQPSYKTSACQP